MPTFLPGGDGRRQPAAGGWRPAAGGWRLAAGGWRPEKTAWFKRLKIQVTLPLDHSNVDVNVYVDVEVDESDSR
jgi:hypothetical protein